MGDHITPTATRSAAPDDDILDNRVLVPRDRSTIETSPSPQSTDTTPAGDDLVALTAHDTDAHRLALTNQEIVDEADSTGYLGTDTG